MVRPPCCEGKDLKKGPWTPEEDERLVEYVGKRGHSNWKAIPKLTGLNRCGKSCRLRWTNYLRPDIKRGKFSDEEEHLIVNLHAVLGNKWSRIATHLPGRTDNEIKNYWNTHIRKKLLQMGIDPITHKPRNDPNQQLLNLVQLLGGAAAQPTNFNNSNNNNPLDSILLMKLLQPVDAAQLMKMELLQNLLLAMNTSTNTLRPTNNNQYTNMANLIPQNIVNPLVYAPPQDLNSNHLHQVNSDGVRSDSEAYLDQVMASYGGGGLNINESEKENTNKLSELVSASISPETSSYDALFERKSNSSTCENSPTSAIFEDWEKLLDEESFDAYWKDFLE